ncbi:MAG: ATP-binding protein [Hydrogenophaga sp.]|uniref:HAMP domain-containing sensor histidine kinase n=1 Tax=Hydrogenophaga sp. TaxID=1904254 RepID=UPI00271CF775|nr:ATP-binding protein [Hydrogenophaga sp.]MDO9148522.1 ATP-binding protein [Hydrogenophaga sp.]MDP2163554.1 ATP-binding protein [Hydrogenophaga sp.]MDP3474825.1 ATP-binding protein [Hydrogenophaga sp.]
MDSLIGQKLYLRIWLAVVAAVAVLTLVVGWLWQVALDHEREQNANRAGREIVLRNGAGDIVGQAPARAVRVPGEGLEFQVTMKDGQTLYVQLPRANRPPGSPLPARRAQAWLQSAPGFAWLLGLVAIAVALGAYPIVRRLTKRLEALQKGVERWGDGDLSTRLPVQGQDEIAFLATRFNAAAERVQTLLQSHKALLANASHELRSPLARLRMGLELLGRDSASAPQRQEMARSIEELDQLIDEILLASRLDARDANDASALGPTEEVDLVGLAAEECARTGADLDIAPGASPVLLQGHARLLRRLLRNLLENARRYGTRSPSHTADEPADADVRLTMALQTPGQGGPGNKRADNPTQRVVEICVEDRGPGVPPDQRERIFEPFYRLPGASEREGGVGLGLSLVRTIAERHGGLVRCEARDGGGARFVVQLPFLG